MISAGYEPTLAEVLADPIIRAVMAADHIDPSELAATFNLIARQRDAKDNAIYSESEKR